LTAFVCLILNGSGRSIKLRTKIFQNKIEIKQYFSNLGHNLLISMCGVTRHLTSSHPKSIWKLHITDEILQNYSQIRKKYCNRILTILSKIQKNIRKNFNIELIYINQQNFPITKTKGVECGSGSVKNWPHGSGP
jgi:hypothetical protein